MLRSASVVFGLFFMTSAPEALAGQVRIDVLANFFAPEALTLNQGDHVVWVWVGGHHSVTSGTGCGSITGQFDSGAMSSGTFSWKAAVVGAWPYYCVPHCTYMLGALTVVPSGAPVADFRISEIQVTEPVLDRVEITNLGAATGDLGRFRIAYAPAGVVELARDHLPILPGATMTLHLNASGESDASNLYVPGGASLPQSGSFALYAPNTVNPSLSDPSMIVDFVQWGTGGAGNEPTAVVAGIWSVGGSIIVPSAGHSMELCDFAIRGPASWSEVSVPNFGTQARCTTATRYRSWGALKLHYR